MPQKSTIALRISIADEFSETGDRRKLGRSWYMSCLAKSLSNCFLNWNFRGCYVVDLFGITETKTPSPNNQSDERGARPLGVSPDVAEMNIEGSWSVFAAHGSRLSSVETNAAISAPDVARAGGCNIDEFV
jgi:hypothetical protein